MLDRTHSVLVLFCKQPRLGFGKQRLAAKIGATNAFHIAESLLACAMEDVATWPGEIILAPSARSELAWARSLAQLPIFGGRSIRVEEQCCGNLGERLMEMDTRIRDQGARRMVFMASDAPSLKLEYFEEVESSLNDYDIVLADDLDGGVTLMAGGCPWPTLNNLPWSTDRLGDALAAACREAGLSVYRFDGGFDIDTEDDLRRLPDFLKRDARPARQKLLRLLVEELELNN